MDLWSMGDLATPMAVRVAATLRIADHITAGVDTEAGLASATDAHADTLGRVLRHLVTVGVLRRGDDGRYALTDLGDGLRDDHPGGMRQLLDIDGGIGRGDLAFVQLLHSVRTGDAAFPAQFGQGFWDDLATDPARRAAFDREMSVDVTRWAPAIIGAYDWGALGHVVDVGGGDGSLLVALLQTFPGLRGTVIEVAGTTDAARAKFASAGLSDRADAIVGNFFGKLPPHYPAYVLTAIIHDWSDEFARTILRRCTHAAGAEGRVFVIEKIGTDGKTPNTAMDLRLLAYMGGRERDLTELTALVESTGCRVNAIHPAGAIVILELTPANEDRTG